MRVLLSRSGRVARLLTPACAFSSFHSSCFPLPHAFQGWTRLPPGPLTSSPGWTHLPPGPLTRSTHRLPGMDPPASGSTRSTHRVHSLAPRDGPTFLRAHSPSLEPFCSDVYLCPSHVSLCNRSQLSLQKTTGFL